MLHLKAKMHEQYLNSILYTVDAADPVVDPDLFFGMGQFDQALDGMLFDIGSLFLVLLEASNSLFDNFLVALKI